jgi:hypothetical protein
MFSLITILFHFQITKQITVTKSSSGKISVDHSRLCECQLNCKSKYNLTDLNFFRDIVCLHSSYNIYTTVTRYPCPRLCKQRVPRESEVWVKVRVTFGFPFNFLIVTGWVS